LPPQKEICKNYSNTTASHQAWKADRKESGEIVRLAFSTTFNFGTLFGELSLAFNSKRLKGCKMTNQSTDQLFRQLSKIPLLKPDEEKRLWAEMKNDNSFDARQELIERYQPLVCRIIGKLRPHEQVYLDLFQEGIVGLVEAVERFEPERGYKFSTYATFRIRGRALTYLQKASRHNQQMPEMDKLALLTAGKEKMLKDPDDIAQDAFLLERIHYCIQELPPKERRAFEAVILQERAPKDVSQELGISRSYLSRLLKKSWRRIKLMIEDIEADYEEMVAESAQNSPYATSTSQEHAMV
jgi:RNA polymerase sporulation-specific sigma factor